MKEGSDACFISLLFGKTELGTSVFSQEDIRHTVDLAWQRQQHQHQTVKTQVRRNRIEKKKCAYAGRGAARHKL